MSLINLVFSLACFALSVRASTQPVPVLIWSPTSLPTSPSLKQVNSVAFNELLHEAIGTQKSHVAVFVEDKLSSEDFSLRSEQTQSTYDNLKDVTRDHNILYLPSAENPMKVVRSLQAEGYDIVRYEGQVPTDLKKPTILIVPLHDDSYETKSSILRSHYELIDQVYSQLAESYSNVMGMYTGRQNSWNQSVKRARRADADADPTPALLVMRSEGMVAIASAISIADSETAAPINITGINQVTVSNGTDGEILLKAMLAPSGELTLAFDNTRMRQWALKYIKLGENVLVTKDLDTWAPVGWSWACNGLVVFRATPVGGASHTASVNITGLQVQPDVGADNKFGQAMDCVPYFSIPIWTGLVVSVLLLSILSWGLMMLMDINTNDRFDDPKGKTITISATD